ncbi:peptide deformylase [Patescibacteria group bacterium]|nr:peptide deformylase [Patescibacteria group bacterium]
MKATKDPIVQNGEEVLRQTAAPIAKKDIASRAVRGLIARMKKVLNKEPHGVGLAACQLGVPLQLFIISGRAFVADHKNQKQEKKLPPDLVVINPELVRSSKKQKEMSEGCLSVRGKYGSVVRFEKVTIRALDESGKPFVYNASGLPAHVIQHELDHLRGQLFIDKTKKLEEWEDDHE